MQPKDAHDVARAMLDCSPTIVIRGYREADVLSLIDYIRSVYPLLFHLGNITYDIYANHDAVLRPQYVMEKTAFQNLLQQVTKKVSEIQAEAKQYKSELLQEKYIHDYFCKHVRYADVGMESHSILGPLLWGHGVCEGVAKAVQLLLKSVGIEAFLLAGTSQSEETAPPEPHAWNVVQIDGKWYHLDVTFDMTISSGYVRYDYFNVNSTAISGDHVLTFDPGQKAPLCTSGEDIFVLTNRCFKNAREAGLLFRSLLITKKQYLHFRMEGPYNDKQSKEIFREFEETIRICKKQLSYSYSINKHRNVYAFYINHSYE